MITLALIAPTALAHVGSLSNSGQLEAEPHAELELPHLCASSEAEYLTCCPWVAIHTCVRQTEVHLIEDIEALCTKFQIRGFGYFEVLEDREVGLEKQWPMQAVAASVSVLTRRRFGPGCSRTNSHRKPAIAAPMIEAGIADAIWSAGTSVHRAVCAKRYYRREWQSAHPGGNRVELPAAKEKINGSVRVSKKLLAASEWQFPHFREDKDVLAILIGGTAAK